MAIAAIQPNEVVHRNAFERSGAAFLLRAVPRTFPIRESANMSTKTKPAKLKHHLDRRADTIIAQGDLLDGSADDLLTTAQTATWLGVSTQFLEIGRSKGAYGPPHVVLAPRVIRYRRDEVNQWLRERSVASVADRRAKLGKG